MFYYITTQNQNVFNMRIYELNTKYLIMSKKTKTNKRNSYFNKLTNFLSKIYIVIGISKNLIADSLF